MGQNFLECKNCLINSDIAEIKKYNGELYCQECIDMLEYPIDKNKVETEWNEYISKIKEQNKNREHDILFAFSGGKDSVAALYFIVKKYGLRPLVFTIDHGFKSDTIMENCKKLVDHFKLDWIIKRVDDSITEEIRTMAKNGDLPCVKCGKLWKAGSFKSVADLTGIDIIFTGGDTLVNGKAILDAKPEWGVQSVGLPLAVNYLNEQQIYDICYRLGWTNPQIKGWDTDCTAVGAGLYNYRNQNGCYHVEELKHLAHRVRYGILEKEDARTKLLAEFDVDPEIMALFK